MSAYREWAPPPSLRPWLRCVWMRWLGEGDGETVRVLPDACTDLMWMEGTLRLAGPDTTVSPAWCPPGSRIVGVRFRPGALVATTGADLSGLVNQRVAVDDVWGGDVLGLNERAAEATGAPVRAVASVLLDEVAGRVSKAATPDPVVRAVVAACLEGRRPLGVRTLAAELYISERQLRRRCRQALGYGPKTLDRILRFQRFVQLSARAPRSDLATAAAAVGYADQAHLARECQRLAGVAPTGLLADPS